ncbi:MAG: ATP-binding protein, partial [Xanthobacteraceae bacterium]
QQDSDTGTYVGDVRTSTRQAPGTALFDVSQRLPAAGGSFRGVIAVAVRPRYFDDFYAMIEQSPGNFYALVRPDGRLLARYPSGPQLTHQLSPQSALRQSIGRGLTHGLYSVDSEVDGRSRRVGFRELPGYPVYAIAGIDSAAIRAAWLHQVGGHLIFGLPVTLLLFSTLWVVLRRTKRLYDEAQRREFAEDALRQAQRLEAIGQLTGGVAHDFNNLLMIVSGTVARLRRHVSGEKEVQLLDAIANATARGESLTRQLLAFSRRQMHQPCVIDLAERLPEIKDMLSRSLRGDIDIRLGVPRRPCAVKVDPSEFELALLNLAFNARDAMPSGGTLTISAKPTVLRGKGAEEGLSGDYVAVRVADTGTGIPPEVLPRVFEPFFTTKDVGKGTGLGLSMVYGIIKQTGGYVFCDSEPGNGATFRIFLPRRVGDEIDEPVKVEAARPAADLTGRGAILLVEDEEAVRAFAARALASRGYTVLQAETGLDALRVVEAASEPIDLIVSDVIMPEMDGPTMLTELRKRGLTAKVVFVSGYADDAFARNLPEGQDFVFLPKPFSLKQLIETVKGLMN